MPESALARIKDSPAADRAKQELEGYLMAQAERALAGAGRAMGRSTAHLTAMADGTSPGLRALALDSARKVAKGRAPLRAVVEAGAKQVGARAAHAVRDRLTRRGGRPGRGRPTLIMESVDVGVPVKDAYNQWTRYRDFPEFAQGVTSAEAVDETTSDWNAKIFWSHRSWTAHVTEQVPDERIAWTSEGAKGTTRGVVTFHELTVDLTRVLLAIEYHPRGLLEKTANLWRAQGRRVRLDLGNYARFLTLKGGQADGWRGEVHDGELVDEDEAELEEAYRGEDGDEAFEGGEDGEEAFEDDEGYEDDEEGVAEDPDVDYEDEAEGPEADYEHAERDGEPDPEEAEPDREPEDEPEAARPRGRRGSRRSA
ncbi:SRPBCC family protein [Streptomyces sp. NPDC048270]|uniref:SRPBCC family protein n=1 Tax=Streptomyces sp. NPDC048270 TaxID=3154615 RepID=UPI0033D53F41